MRSSWGGAKCFEQFMFFPHVHVRSAGRVRILFFSATPAKIIIRLPTPGAMTDPPASKIQQMVYPVFFAETYICTNRRMEKQHEKITSDCYRLIDSIIGFHGERRQSQNL